MHWMVCSVRYLGWMVVNINARFAERRIAEREYFQILLLVILSGMEPNMYLFSDIDAVTATFNVLDGIFLIDLIFIFPGLIFPQLQTCSTDCTEDSHSSNIPSNF